MATIIGYAHAKLGAPVTLTNANQWYDGPSVELGAGTWKIGGTAYLGNAGAGEICARISDGTTHHASGGHYDAAGSRGSVPLGPVEVVLENTTTIKIQAASVNAASVLDSATTSNGSGNNATVLWAERKA